MTKARDLASGGFGLVLVKPSSVVGGTDNGKGTVTFSAASTVSLNGCFNSIYDNYKIVIDEIPSTTGDLTFRFRVSGSDNSTSNYERQYLAANGTGTFVGRVSGATSWTLNGGRLANRHFYEINVSNPALAVVKGAVTALTSNYESASNVVYSANAYGFKATTIFDGFSLITSAGTFTGAVSVYGYNK